MEPRSMFIRTGRNDSSGSTVLKTRKKSSPMSGTSTPLPSTSTTPPPLKTHHALHLEEWGWRVALAKVDDYVSLEVRTPVGKGYSLTVDEDGNVTELIQGNYLRVV